ncbi:unnamed protein product [Urochloa humidicola]
MHGGEAHTEIQVERGGGAVRVEGRGDRGIAKRICHGDGGKAVAATMLPREEDWDDYGAWMAVVRLAFSFCSCFYRLGEAMDLSGARLEAPVNMISGTSYRHAMELTMFMKINCV